MHGVAVIMTQSVICDCDYIRFICISFDFNTL